MSIIKVVEMLEPNEEKVTFTRLANDTLEIRVARKLSSGRVAQKDIRLITTDITDSQILMLVDVMLKDLRGYQEESPTNSLPDVSGTIEELKKELGS